MTQRVRLALVLFAALPLLPVPAGRTDARPDLRARYTKREYRVPMRDGAKLFTTVYLPRGAGRNHRYPILLTRTPYSVGPYGSELREDIGPSEAAAREGFIFAYQDVRGRFMSEGDFVDVRPRSTGGGPERIDETTDARDTIDWLLERVDGHNGRVGVWGISYPGFYAVMAAIDAHPAVVAVSAQAPIADWFMGDDFHHNGAFFLPHAFNFYSAFGRPRPRPTTEWGPAFDHGTLDGYRFFLETGPLANFDRRHLAGEVAFWKQVMEHETYDAFWQARNTRPHLRAIRPAMLTVGGWYDAEDLFGALQTYGAVERQGAIGSNRLVMGPWSHGAWARGSGEALGRIRFGKPTARFFQERIELPFFRSLLKDGREPDLPEAQVFETGRNEWRQLDAWPPREARALDLFLHERGRLARTPPTVAGEAFDEYVSDPDRPVPFVEEVAIGMSKEYMVADQRFAARRPDVLVYQTEPLEEDLTVAGPVTPRLHVSTSGTDSDWVVKLVDVYPDDHPLQPGEREEGLSRSRMGGYQQLVRGEPFRGKFRRSFSRPEPFVPGQPDEVSFSMPDAFHTFRRGHRVMVQVQSTWFPLVDRNPQSFVDIRRAVETDFRKATQRVWRSAERASAVRLLVLAH